MNQQAPASRRPKLKERVRLPSVSGKTSAVGLVVCFAVTALLIPMAAHAQPWIRFEIVLAVWWCIWAALLTTLLFGGRLVDHDYDDTLSIFGRKSGGADAGHIAGKSKTASKKDSSRRRDQSAGEDESLAAGGSENRANAADATGTKSKKKPSSGSSWGWDPWSSALYHSGGWEFLIWLLAPIVLFLAAWFLIEVAIPILAFLMYVIVGGMLQVAVNHRNSCCGSLTRSTYWGIVWATIYTAPLAVLVWMVHSTHASKPAPAAGAPPTQPTAGIPVIATLGLALVTVIVIWLVRDSQRRKVELNQGDVVREN
jgi:hypothetical protein